MSLGLAIRTALILAWLGLMTVHVVTYALPGILVAERSDLAATLHQQSNRTLTYRVLAGNDDVGSCTIGFETGDAGYRIDTRIDLTRIPGLPSTITLPGSANLDSGLRASASQHLDHRLMLTAIEAEGDLFGIAMTMTGTVDHQGLHGSIEIGGTTQTLDIPDLGRDAGQGFDLALSLPPGLKTGEEFRTSVIDFGLSLSPQRAVAVFTVEQRERIETADGPLELLHVGMTKGSEPYATLWCDDEGTVYRSRLARSGVSLELSAIHDRRAGRIWPHFTRP